MGAGTCCGREKMTMMLHMRTHQSQTERMLFPHLIWCQTKMTITLLQVGAPRVLKKWTASQAFLTASPPRKSSENSRQECFRCRWEHEWVFGLLQNHVCKMLV